MESPELPRLYTVPEAARRLGLGRDAIREAIARGDLHAVVLTPNGWPRLETQELRRWSQSLRLHTERADRGPDAPPHPATH